MLLSYINPVYVFEGFYVLMTPIFLYRRPSTFFALRKSMPQILSAISPTVDFYGEGDVLKSGFQKWLSG